jgi:hypothetical protein
MYPQRLIISSIKSHHMNGTDGPADGWRAEITVFREPRLRRSKRTAGDDIAQFRAHDDRRINPLVRRESDTLCNIISVLPSGERSNNIRCDPKPPSKPMTT